MFVVSTKPSFTAPVIFNLPGDDGRPLKGRFTAVFKYLDKSAVDDLMARINERQKMLIEDPTAATMKDRDVVDEVLAGFGPDLVEEDRTPMAFTPANVDRLCSIVGVQAAIVTSFFDNFFVKAPTKN
jgi:hypothetical protein